MQKKVWKRIANKINEKGYNITDEQCCVKWNLKQKYKNIRDRNNQTGRDRQSWEYFDMIDDFITSKPEVTPVSIASSTHGFRIRQSSSPEEEIEESTNENNSAAANTSNIERNIRKRRKSEPTWIKVLCEQREAHHEENIQMQKKFLTLFEKYLQKNNAQ